MTDIFIPFQELSPEHIQRPKSALATEETAQNSVEVDAQKSDPANNNNGDGDIEEGLSSSSSADDEAVDENVNENPVDIDQNNIEDPAILNKEIVDITESADIEEGVVPSDPVEDNREIESKDTNNRNIEENATGETELATQDEQAADDDASDAGSSDGEMMEVISFNGEEDGMVLIPMAGECRHDVLPENLTGTQRKEPNGCAICLCPFEVADKVTWSSNPSCQHVFHQECIKDWLMASGRKFLKRQRREQRRTGNLSYDSDPIGKITGFPMLCPCCRQYFIMPEEEEESVDEKNATPESNNAEMGDTEAMMVAAS